METCWQILGMAAPTPDERDIKRAYAKLLKNTRPEEDPDGFCRLREAYETALYAAQNLPLPTADAAPEAATAQETGLEDAMRPYVQKMSELNETGSAEEALQCLKEALEKFGLHNPEQRDPLAWEIFEDGLLFVCCEIQANHDEFLRYAVDLCGWLQPTHWLRERDPRTVEWLALRLQEADALELLDAMMQHLASGDEETAQQQLQQIAHDERLVHVDVRLLFEAELMISLSALEPVPQHFAKESIMLFGWNRDTRYLEEYHPEAWKILVGKLVQAGIEEFSTAVH